MAFQVLDSFISFNNHFPLSQFSLFISISFVFYRAGEGDNSGNCLSSGSGSCLSSGRGLVIRCRSSGRSSSCYNCSDFLLFLNEKLMFSVHFRRNFFPLLTRTRTTRTGRTFNREMFDVVGGKLFNSDDSYSSFLDSSSTLKNHLLFVDVVLVFLFV